MTNLENCKYCHAEAETRQIGRIGNYYVSCTKCNHQTIGYDTIEAAIFAWNQENKTTQNKTTQMTEQEKIEKLLNHLEKFGDTYECETYFANEEKWKNRYNDDWCGQHCQWNHPHKECFKHFLLGE